MPVKTVIIFLLVVSFLNNTLHKERNRKIPEFKYKEIPKTEVGKIKKFILSKNKKISNNVAENFALNIVRYSNFYQVDPKLITALICRESRFNKNAVSRSGAMGLGQLLPQTAKDVGVSDPFDPEQNIRGTVAYFRKMLDRFPNHPKKIDMALASYRIGYGIVKIYQDVPPLPEVKKFIESIKKLYEKI
jgi:soluble lytic murein transglycosylase-like protein